jgi:hypothetical protein
MKTNVKTILLVLLATALLTGCQKKEQKTVGSAPVAAPAGNSSDFAARMDTLTGEDSAVVHHYFEDGTAIGVDAVDKSHVPEAGEESVDVVGDNVIDHHFFTSPATFYAWVSQQAFGTNLVNHIGKCDDLRAKVEAEGVIDYYEIHGELPQSFADYLINGNYNWAGEMGNRTSKTSMMGSFYKNYSTNGGNFPTLTCHYVGSGWNDQISFHAALQFGFGILSICDGKFWAKPRKHFVFVGYTFVTYYGWWYDDMTTSTLAS